MSGKNPFDPINNLDEWIMLDWEFEDSYEQDDQANAEQNQPEQPRQGSNGKTPWWAWILAALLTIGRSPILMIVIVILILLYGC